MKRTQHIAYFKVPYKQKDNDNYQNNDNFCCGDKKSSKGDGVTDNENPELNQFYYHSDHLGSSSYITNLKGSIVQHIEYVPFGEVFIEERNNKWNTPYLFNGKELDEETGLYYYGARYYSGKTSLWLSVDPLAEKYPGISPYCYTMNNPVKFIDPDGREVWIYYQNKNGDEQKMQYKSGMDYKGDNKFIASSVKYLNQMGSTEVGGKLLGSLIDSENSFNIKNTFAKDKRGNNIKGALAFDGSDSRGGQIHAAELLNSNISKSAKLENIAHELFHGYQHENGQGGASIFNEVEAMVFGVAVSTQYSFCNMTIGGGSSTSLGKNANQTSKIYQSSFQDLLYNKNFPKKSFISAVKNFKQGAAKNISGMYNNHPLRRSNQTKSMLNRFYPLIK